MVDAVRCSTAWPRAAAGLHSAWLLPGCWLLHHESHRCSGPIAAEPQTGNFQFEAAAT
eukprot:COSAG01_NODE_6147_length_3824_cov_60.751946_6_plen_58_part_00